MRPDREPEVRTGCEEIRPGLPIWGDLLEGTAFGVSGHWLGVAIPQGSSSGESVTVTDEGEWLMW